MHGRKKIKTTEEKEREKLELDKKRALHYSQLIQTFFERRKNNDYNEDTLKLTSQILEYNGDCYTAWNYRRQIFLEWEKIKTKEAMNKIYQDELQFLEKALQAHPKSYWAWFHRKWITQRPACHCDWQRELNLCTKALSLDSRNFHCWSYRRYCVEKAKITAQEELNYTTKMIEENFSNYSAWHQRSKLLPRVYENDPVSFNAAIRKEFDFVRQAFYTEPEDQSAWIYHRWLVGVSKELYKENPEEFKEILRGEVTMCDDLLKEEPNCKWPLLTKVFLLHQLGEKQNEIRRYLKQLQNIDSAHREYYVDLEKRLV
jgi:geranylgeranyl transferase type-2 subunit alpha